MLPLTGSSTAFYLVILVNVTSLLSLKTILFPSCSCPRFLIPLLSVCIAFVTVILVYQYLDSGHKLIVFSVVTKMWARLVWGSHTSEVQFDLQTAPHSGS